MTRNDDLTAQQRIDLLKVSKELAVLHARVFEITRDVQTRPQELRTSGQLIDIQFGISDTMEKIHVLFT